MQSTYLFGVSILSLVWGLPAHAEGLPIQDPLVKTTAAGLRSLPAFNAPVTAAAVPKSPILETTAINLTAAGLNVAATQLEIVTPEIVTPSETAPRILTNPVQNGQVQITPIVDPLVDPSVNPLTEMPATNLALIKPHIQQVRQALIKSNQRYPFLVNPMGKIQSRLNFFTPSQRPRNSSLNLNFANRQVTIDNLATAKFPTDQQLYWILPGNRIVIETRGTMGTIEYQGRATDRTIIQNLKTTQALWGLQAAWLLPQALQDLVREDKFQNSSILSIAGEVTNPSNPQNVRINLNTTQVTDRISPTIDDVKSSELTEVVNSPVILQAFPTTNLQVLLEGEGLFKGARVSPDLLAKAGIVFGNPFTGEGFQFNPIVTSLPGIKVARPEQFENRDLLNVLMNPFLTPKQRQLSYLNSLNWVSLGVRLAKIFSTTTTDVTQNWYQGKFSQPHNRTLLQYETTPGRATYYNLFVNPGVALDFSFDAKGMHLPQSLNATAGALLGGLFGLIHPFRLEKSVWEARLQYNREETFKPLRTQTTPEQRQQINHRLDRALNIAQLNSGIKQLSGSITLPTALTPTRSDMFQVRVGNHQRQVQFADVTEATKASEIYISKISLSDQTFGPLKTISIPIPTKLTNLATESTNKTSSIRTIVTSGDGTSNFEQSNDLDLTNVPLGLRTFDTASDRIELSQIGTVTTLIKSFDGYTQMPAIEALWQRSRGAFNYALSTGAWLNLSRDTAPNVNRNGIGPQEKPIGLYTNAAVNWSKSQTMLKPDKSLKQARTQVATAQFSWNTASNVSNPTYLNLNYSYLQQSPKFNWTSTIGVFLAAYNQQIEPITFWRNQLGSRSGFDVISSVEIKNRTNLLFEAVQAIGSNWSLGGYYQNFQTTPGLNRRIVAVEKGLIVKHRSRRGNTWQARIKFDRDWSLQLQSNLNF